MIAYTKRDNKDWSELRCIESQSFLTRCWTPSGYYKGSVRGANAVASRITGACERPLEHRLDIRLAGDLAADVADDTTKPAARMRSWR